MASGGTPGRYVIDTHTWHWYLQDAPQLGPGARAALKLVELGHAQLLLPAIVLAEFVCLCEKLGISSSLETVGHTIASSNSISLVELGLAQLLAFEKMDPTLEMHDRLILADALLAQATVITRDHGIQSAGLVPTIW